MSTYTTYQALKDYHDELHEKELEAQNVYSAIGAYFKWRAETVYEDTIISLVGETGLSLLKEFHLIETCGIIQGRKLYAM